MNRNPPPPPNLFATLAYDKTCTKFGCQSYQGLKKKKKIWQKIVTDRFWVQKISSIPAKTQNPNTEADSNIPPTPTPIFSCRRGMGGIMKAHSTATFITLLYPQETLICEPTSSSCGCFPCCEIDGGAPGLCPLSAPDSCYDCAVCWPNALLVHLLASCACPPSPSHAGHDDPSPIADRQKPKDCFKYPKTANWAIVHLH